MASDWRQKLARISGMNWEEVRVRAGQELQKQGDLIRHQMGVPPGTVRFDTSSELRPGNFFFSSAEVSLRAEMLRTYLPGQVGEIVHDADEICAHRFELLGYENLSFASAGSKGEVKGIDWHFDPVHGKQAPLAPWFKIPFLDFGIVGDHKVIWELNRHQHLVTLAKARLLTGDEKYTVELLAQWRSWKKENPYPLGINWGSSLEVAFRSLSWIWVDQLLAGVPAMAEFRAELLPALAFQGHYIERYISTYFSPNTHLLGEAVALFFLGTLYPQMPGAARWKESGWNIVQREAERQVRPDGVYFEQSLHYHVYALDFFLYARLLANRNEIEIPPGFDAVVGRMLEVVAALAQAGPAEGFGDDDGGRLFNPRRNRAEHMTDPLAVGAVIYSKKFPSAGLTEEAIWLLGSQAIEKLYLDHAPTSAPANAVVHSAAFPDGGLYVMADSQPFAQVLAIDAGPQGIGRSGHGHADALSLRLTMDGERWLVDAGSGVYISKDAKDRNTFRGTGAHNTLRVDGADQAVADEPFSWTHIPTTVAEKWTVGNSFSYFVGSHDGYERLADPVRHRRHVLKIAGGAWLVRDVALGHSEHELEIRWHFAPGLEARSGGDGQAVVSRPNAPGNAAGLRLMAPAKTVWQKGMEIGTTEISPAYGALQAAPLVRFHARVMLPAETATALVLQPSTIGLGTEPSFRSLNQPEVQVYEIEHGETSQQFFFALGEKAWDSGKWSSDAAVLYCGMEKSKLTHLIVIGGSSVAWQGKPVASLKGASRYFEWDQQNGVSDGGAGAFELTALFGELTGEERPMSEISSTYAEKN